MVVVLADIVVRGKHVHVWPGLLRSLAWPLCARMVESKAFVDGLSVDAWVDAANQLGDLVGVYTKPSLDNPNPAPVNVPAHRPNTTA